jgi:cytosine/adenosine deaminase-related metal-dependent hydrolase
MRIRILFAALLLIVCSEPVLGNIEPAPDRAAGEGPYERLILRGATLINSTGAPPIGPVDIVIEEDRIARIEVVGYPGVPIEDSERPEAGPQDRELDLSGMYVLPGFIDMHAHIGGAAQGTPAEYVFKLWMGHGITTIREPGSFNGIDWVLEHREKSERNTITAPRIVAYAGFGMDQDRPIESPAEARRWIRRMERRGVDGFKFFGAPPEILEAAIREASERGLGTAQHHAQLEVGRANVLDTSSWGLTTMEHWYGLPEALFEDRTLQDYPADYNYQNEYHRFSEAGRLWQQAAEPGSEHWNRVRDRLIENGLTLNPTMTIYEANRDLMAQRRAEWHEEYTLPSLWSFFGPDREAHGSYWFDWTTQDEINWREGFDIWMRFLRDYRNHGGRVTLGSDAGYIYKLYGFGYIQEMELFQEAGFQPLEIIRAATLDAAETLGVDDQLGSVEVGKLADLVVVEENPLDNFKVLYGTGAIRVDEANRLQRVGGVRYTIKDGIVYDAEALRADVREMVDQAREAEGVDRLHQPAADY